MSEEDGKEGIRKLVWNRCTDAEEGSRMMMAQADQFADRNNARKAEALWLYRIYESISDDDLGERADAVDDEGDIVNPKIDEPLDMTLPIAADIVDTLVAKITREEVKPQIVCNEARWEVRRKAKLGDRLCQAIFEQQQGKYFNLWDIFREGLRMALAATRTSAVKIYSDIPAKKVRAELHDTLTMWVDTTGHPYDYPTQLGEITYWDPEKLCDALGNDCKSDIEEAIFNAVQPVKHVGLERLDDDYDYQLTERIDRVPVYEAWKFRCGQRMGRYCMAIPGKNLKWLPYKHEDPPFIFVGGIRGMVGFWHRTLTKPIAQSILWANEVLGRAKASENLTPKRVVYFDPEEIPAASMETTDDVLYIPVPGLNSRGAKVQTETPAPFHPLVLELVQYLQGQPYNLSGVGQMHTQADVKGEAWSGVALRLRKNLLDERMSPIHRGYINASVIQASKHVLRACKEIYDADPSFSALWTSDRGYSMKIDGEVLSVLDDNNFKTDVYAVSEDKDTPEDRMQFIKELTELGIATGEAFMQAARDFDTSNLSDVPDELRTFVEKQIDSWLYADLKQFRKKDFYKGPFATMGIKGLLVSMREVSRGQLRALTDEVEPRRVQLFNRWLTDAKGLVEDAMKAQAPTAPAQPIAPPMPPGAPMPPPMVPPPVAPPPGAMAPPQPIAA